MECKLAICKLLVITLDSFVEEKLDEIIGNYFQSDLQDHAALVADMMQSVENPVANPAFAVLKESRGTPPPWPAGGRRRRPRCCGAARSACRTSYGRGVNVAHWHACGHGQGMWSHRPGTKLRGLYPRQLQRALGLGRVTGALAGILGPWQGYRGLGREGYRGVGREK